MVGWCLQPRGTLEFLVFPRREWEAAINRGISLLQTLHQRRYMEQFTWHPRSRVDQFAV